MIPFGEWLPDQAQLGAATEIKNVVPFLKDYGELRSTQSFSSALQSTCLGAVSAKAGDQVAYNFAGDASALYHLQNTQWQNVSKTGGYINSQNWVFAQFGSRIIAVSRSTVPQYFDMVTSTAFADLPGSPPTASACGVIRGFLVLGDLVDGNQEYESRIRWSGYNNTGLWTPSRATQSDLRDLHGAGGPVQHIESGQVGYIFQEYAIWSMVYSGPPAIFTLNQIEVGRGTPAPNSVVRLGESLFFLSNDGFYRMDPGGRLTPIGAEKVDRWFFSRVNTRSIRHVSGAVDPANHLILWSFCTASFTDLGCNDLLLIYNWSSNRWSYGEVHVEMMMALHPEGYSLDTLDTVLPNGIDSDSIPVDSPAYQSGKLTVAAFDGEHRACTFNGAPLTAVLETEEIGGGEHKTLVRRFRPVVQGQAPAINVCFGRRANQHEPIRYGPFLDTNAMGEATEKSKSRYHRFRVHITNGFEHAIGGEIMKTRQAGRK